MKKVIVIFLIVASVLCVVGVVVGALGLFMIGFDLTRLGTEDFETNSYELTEDFENISIDTKTASVSFERSDDGVCRVVCKEQKKIKHSVEVKDGTLTVSAVDSRKWYEHIVIFSFGEAKVTVYLPDDEYNSISVDTDTGNVKMPESLSFANAEMTSDTGDIAWNASVSGKLGIGTDTGDVRVNNVSAGELRLTSDTGKITASAITSDGEVSVVTSTGEIILTDVGCASARAESDTGDITLKDVIAADSITAQADTGEIVFDRSDADTVYAETKTGDIDGSLLSEKIFFADSKTGRVSVPRTETGGRCELMSDTGDIEIKIQNQ
ncbi:MAG: DUF4097 family beta strand repeat protein [Clostridia bacterium]|nr:DUF4097 family beta strand repeat protein [Clostridia bacterium]